MKDNATPHDAAQYDMEVAKTIPFYHQFHTETVNLVRTVVPPVSVWLDTGCGTGCLVEHALSRFPGTRFLIADPAPAMLDLARARLAAFPPGRVRVLGAMPTERLAGSVPEPPQVITAIQSHHYGGDEARKAATEVCFRLLQPNGLYVTFENIRPDTARGIEIGLDRWCAFQEAAGRSAQAVAEHRLRFGRDYFPITVPEHLRLLKRTGFSVIEVFWMSHMQAGIYAIK